jgi:hypothetical protein
MNITFPRVIAAALLALAPAHASYAADSAPDASQKDAPRKTVAGSAKEVGQEVGRDAKKVGQTVAKDAKAVGEAVKEEAKEVGAAAKRGAKKVKDAVKTS